jgi:hypothetical protein
MHWILTIIFYIRSRMNSGILTQTLNSRKKSQSWEVQSVQEILPPFLSPKFYKSIQKVLHSDLSWATYIQSIILKPCFQRRALKLSSHDDFWKKMKWLFQHLPGWIPYENHRMSVRTTDLQTENQTGISRTRSKSAIIL